MTNYIQKCLIQWTTNTTDTNLEPKNIQRSLGKKTEVQVCMNLVDRMPRRLQAVIKSKDCPTIFSCVNIVSTNINHIPFCQSYRTL